MSKKKCSKEAGRREKNGRAKLTEEVKIPTETQRTAIMARENTASRLNTAER